MELQSLSTQYSKMVRIASPKQKDKVVKLRQCILDTVRKLDAVMKKTKETNADYCFVVVALVVKNFAMSVMNMFSWVEDDPRLAKKFVTILSNTSLFKMNRPFRVVVKKAVSLKKMTEDETEALCDNLSVPLKEYLRTQSRKLDALKAKN